MKVAIIPARGGSKGVPRKNLRLVGGQSLLARAILAARDCGALDHVVVSTDDEEIRDAALRAGAEVPFLRPAHLATDTATTADAVADCVARFEEYIGKPVQTLVLLEPTSPFRRPQKIAEAVACLQSPLRSVISVCALERKPSNIFHKEDNHLEQVITDPSLTFSRRQDMAAYCRLDSSIYVVGRNDFMAQRRFVIDPIGYVEHSQEESINIDTLLDLLFANLIAREGWQP